MIQNGGHQRFGQLVDFLARIPALETDGSPGHGIAAGEEDGAWWVKFREIPLFRAPCVTTVGAWLRPNCPI